MNRTLLRADIKRRDDWEEEKPTDEALKLFEEIVRLRPKRSRIKLFDGCIDVVFYSHRGVSAYERRVLCAPFLLDISARYGFKHGGAGVTLVPPIKADLHICPCGH